MEPRLPTDWPPFGLGVSGPGGGRDGGMCAPGRIGAPQGRTGSILLPGGRRWEMTLRDYMQGRARALRSAGADGPALPHDQYTPRRDATLSLLTVLMLWQITLSPISRRCAILFMNRNAFPYLLLMALNTDSTVDLAW